jgi:hypothetical protein
MAANMATLMTIKATPTIATHMSAGPGPVTARAPGVPEEEPEAAAEGATAFPAEGDAPGELLDGVLDAVPDDVVAGAGVVELETGAGFGVGVGDGAGFGVGVGDVDVGAEAGNWTTENPASPFPVTWPGDVSPTNVYRGEPLYVTW